MSIEGFDLKQKIVRTEELEAGAEKVRHLKQADKGPLLPPRILLDWRRRQAGRDADTLPLREAAQQRRSRGEARKRVHVERCGAAAQAKGIDSRRELEEAQPPLAGEAAAHPQCGGWRTADRMKRKERAHGQARWLIRRSRGALRTKLQDNEMVPLDASFFFAKDVFKTNGSWARDSSRSPAAARA